MKKSIQVLLTITAMAMAANAHATSILVLGDDASEDIINPYLENQGHTVFSGTNYYDWSGNIPNGVEVILYLDGYDYGYGLGEYGDPFAANQSMLNFVANGGGLIFTEWYAYDQRNGQKESVSALLPVTYDDTYYYEAAWNVSLGYEDHDLVKNLQSTSFTEGDGTEDTYSKVIANDGTTVVMEDENGTPLLSYSNIYGGTTVHINDGMAYGNSISDEMLSVINSSLEFAANTPMSVPEPSSIGIFGISLAAFGLSRRKQKALKATKK